MLKGIPKILSPELLKVLAEMGHSDRLVISDGNFPSESMGKNCIVIPQTATYELQNRVFVYKVVEGKAKSAPVEVFKLNNGTEYIVESGLNSGDVVIAEGAGLVREGTIIESQTTQE